jgi:hypothetical protein
MLLLRELDEVAASVLEYGDRHRARRRWLRPKYHSSLRQSFVLSLDIRRTFSK